LLEVPALRAAIVAGKIDGSTYGGECACLVGSLAKSAQVNYEKIPGLRPNSSRPAERWFINIKSGDTPETNQFSALALKWIDELLANLKAVGAFSK
jgi:hypothetical protein